MELNSLSPSDVRRALGGYGLKELSHLQSCVHGEAKEGLKFRYAPSIIARSEVELFGLSMPRFAARAYLNGDTSSFVNARRLKLFVEQAPEFAKRKLKPREQGAIKEASELSHRSPEYLSPARAAEGISRIGDCYLARPHNCEGFEILQVQLAQAYGEAVKTRDRFPGTPFMRAVDMAGGGLCAQACCFMATVLLHEFASGVYGIAEITYYAVQSKSSDGPIRELSLSGLTLESMARYFKRIRLRAPVLALDERHRVVPEDLRRNIKEAAFRAYVRSSMPVVVPVDLGRLFGLQPRFKGGRRTLSRRTESIYGSPDNREKIPPQLRAQGFRHHNHAVVLVGYNKATRQFLFNDPAVRPFVKATATEILEAAPYSEPSRFLPITPADVRIPLLSSGNVLGLFETIVLLQQSPLVRSHYPQTSDDEYSLEHVYLLRCRDLSARAKAVVLEPPFQGNTENWKEALLTSLTDAIPGLVQRLPRGEENWLWVQFTRSSIWFWDAERFGPWSPRHPPAPDRRTLYARLQLIIAAKGDGWETSFFSEALRLSMITSCSVRGATQALSSWPKSVKFAELYTFMHEDGKSFFPRTLGGAGFPTREMGSMCQDLREIRRIAEELANKFKEAGVTIVAFASFIAELTGEGAGAETAQNAYLFLVRLARELQKLEHPVKTIELVGGSLIDGVWPARIKLPKGTDLTYVANILSPRKAITRLLKRLKPIALEALKCDGYTARDGALRTTDKITLAVEMEPGPLFTLAGEGQLRTFASAVEADKLLRQVVGLNLDLPHWALLARLSVEDARRDPLFERIVHAHLSDHGRGHFGDNVLEVVHQNSVFEPWIGLLKERNLLPPSDKYPAFSGYVSLELEACKSQTMLSSCARRARKLGLV